MATGRKVRFEKQIRLTCRLAPTQPAREPANYSLIHSTTCTACPLPDFGFSRRSARAIAPTLPFAHSPRLIDQGQPVPMFGDGTSQA